ncbi:L-fuconolactonase [Lentzea albidocapillata subsp. violacea]|uniref:L-fuconolactonase n=1 Tax=Lentzea albidocapillata subsp. violacea TaxID=128104 RepID=A0A1G9I5G5_9PSEU|nr:amidohydrolase family protein [Lentzea albidocapillata]SDL20487.1 L-fuconolactonase [Lentzea albidocapillata subsp. violacea]
MIVDAHHHLWDLSVRDQGWITDPPMGVLRRSFLEPDFVAAAPAVSTSVLVQTVCVPEETPEFLAIAASSDVVGAVVGWTDLTSAAVGDSLAALVDSPDGSWLRGIRHQVQSEPDPEWLCRKDVWHGLAAVGAAGLVYELLTVPRQMPAARRTVAALPQVEFVVEHCSKPAIGADPGEWAELIRSLAAHENVTCKLSGLVTEADWKSWDVATLRPYFEVVLDAFGPERLMFGSDWPVCLLAATYEEWLGAARELVAELSPDEQAAIFSSTARRVYGL